MFCIVYEIQKGTCMSCLKFTILKSKQGKVNTQFHYEFLNLKNVLIPHLIGKKDKNNNKCQQIFRSSLLLHQN